MEEKKTRLSNEDAHRMTRLYEEAAGRLYEASLIIARNLGYKALPQGFQLINRMVDATEQLRAQDTTQNVAEAAREIVVLGKRIYFITDEGCGYYDEEEKICVSTPCS